MNEPTNEPTEDEQTTMHREWMELQRRRFALDAERDRNWLEHITRQTEAMERISQALETLAKK